MQEKRTTKNFSQTYYSCNHPLFFEFHPDEHKKDYIEGPFSELENILYKHSNLHALKNYEQGILLFNSIEQKLKECLERFNFEGCSSINRHEYINNVLTYLISKYKSIQNYKIKATRKDTIFMKREVSAFLNIILNVYKKLFWEIQRMFNFEINHDNRIFLNQNLQLDEPIRTFYLKNKVEKQHFSFLYYKYLHNKFISYSTDFETFKVLFENKIVTNKVNWIGTKGSLVFFIKQLIKKNLIVNPKNRHWKQVSESILIKDEPILPRELTNQPPPKEKYQKILNQFINRLLSSN